jgi:NAD(P)-dependent dehydrogenase (short-subunit alcohol dehydrogenase family)
MAVALITGTSTGIGFETALALGRAGHTVYATMRSPDRSPELQATATAEGLPVRVVPLDVTDDASVRDAVECVYAGEGRLDALVNNAGISNIGPIEELDLDAFRDTMETNFFGVLRVLKTTLPRMRAHGSGCIVNVSSVAGRVATSPQSPYATSKFALEALSEILAQEVKGFNIRVAIVEPGVIQTAIYEKRRDIPADTIYPQERRFHAIMAASLQHATPAETVAKQIQQIIEGDSWQLRYPVGPDAKPFFAWRRMITDEEWVERNAELDDDAWCARIKQESGVDMRPFL